MERSEAYWILHNMWGKANEEQREALSIAQRDIEFVDLMDDRFLPVKHGQWVIITDEFDCEMMECSCCGAEFYDGDNDTVDCLHNYCPNCGAKMRC